MEEKNRNSIAFEIEKTRYYLGDTDRYIEIDEGDMSFPTRIEDVRKDIDGYVEKLKEKFGVSNLDDIGNVSTGNISDDLAILKEADAFIKDRLNYAFAYDVSNAAFGAASCLSVTKNGEYYFECFLNSVLPVIEKAFGVRIDKLSVRIKKYTDKKGMHPAYKR